MGLMYEDGKFRFSAGFLAMTTVTYNISDLKCDATWLSDACKLLASGPRIGLRRARGGLHTYVFLLGCLPTYSEEGSRRSACKAFGTYKQRNLKLIYNICMPDLT